MRLRKPCKEHGKYDEHPYYAYPHNFGDDLLTCPGGEFLPEGALVIEKVDGEWPDWATRAVSWALEVDDEGYQTGKRIPSPTTLDRLADALTSQVGESETASGVVQRAMAGEAVPYKGMVVGPGMTGLFPDEEDDQVGESE